VTATSFVVADLPGDEELEALNRRVGAIIAKDIEGMLDRVPYSARVDLTRQVLKRLVVVEAQLLLHASMEALERRGRTRELVEAMREGRLMPRLGGLPWPGPGSGRG
jgi:hypothetical protein